MRIVFMGTPEFAVPSLEKILQTDHAVVAVVTQPDRPAGRGRKVQCPAVKMCAQEHGLDVLQPEKLKDEAFITALQQLRPDLVVVVAFRILPPAVLAIPTWGAINLHASLLPKYRGAAPIQWAIAKGETETGVTVFKLDEHIDTGQIILQRATPIGPDEAANALHDRLMTMGVDVLVEAIGQIVQGTATLTAQDPLLATPAPKLKKEDGQIDWSWSAQEIHNRIRGFYPFPGSCTCLNDGRRVEIIRSKVLEIDHGKEPGTVLSIDHGIAVAAGKGAVQVLEVKPECKKVMGAKEFVLGCPALLPGQKLGACNICTE